MNQQGIMWGVMLAGAVATGASVVCILVVRRALEPLVALAGALAFGVTALAFATIANLYGRADAMLWAFAFMIASAGGGFALASTLLYRFEGDGHGIILPDELPPGVDAPAVVVVACVEPRHYDPRATAGMLQSLADEGLLDASIGALPFLFFAQKTRYRVIGDTSPSAEQLSRISERLAHVLDGERISVEWAACSADFSLARMVASAAARGHKRVVVAELVVAEPLHLSQAKAQVDELHLESLGVDVRYTEPLAGTDRMLGMLANRVMGATDEPALTGVALVGHGQPEERARKNPAFDEQETAFLSRLRLMLIDRGFPEHNVRVAWADWGTPDVTSTVRHMAALGCRRILVVPATYPLDTVATRLDLELAVRQARVEESVSALTLPAWKDDEAVIEELRSRIEALLGEER